MRRVDLGWAEPRDARPLQVARVQWERVHDRNDITRLGVESAGWLLEWINIEPPEQRDFPVMAPMQSPRPHLHAIRFYPDAVSLSYIVADFLADGLRANQPAIIIATPEHCAAITAQLQKLGWDVLLLQQRESLLVLDAHQLLSRFMVEGIPDGARFTRVMAPILAQAAHANAGRPTRAYGEMVDVLWKAGQALAAIRLEMLWNHLAHTYEFELLCGYAMGSFYKDTAVEEICDQHTHVGSERGEIARVK